MKVISLTTTNYKRAKHVEIKPDPEGNLVIVAGKNGQGKSSVLDSISAALGGANSKTTPKPIRDGEDRAEIVLETEELTVTRVFTPSGSRLTLTSKDGAKYPKAQAKLDELVGDLSMDPLAFTLLDDKKQLAQLLELVELPFDPDQLEVERKQAFDERTAVNRRVKEFESALAQFGELPDAVPANEVSVSELLGEYRKLEAAQQESDRYLTDLNESQYKVQELERQLAAARKHFDDVSALVANQSDYKADLERMRTQIDGAEETNRLVRKAKERGSLSFQHEAAKGQANSLTAKLDEIAKTKADGLASASFPVDGLGFTEDGVTYQGVPFKQASSAEQIRVSMAMAIALNPKLKVIRIQDGSLLDSDSLALIEETAQEHGYQIWLEVVGDDIEDAYTIIDGEVA
ncbi:AAA family ATPase [Glutamicibacter sp. M10]|uniref:AAA family ATPase n=1 Tax=Glutamicibacter sp. M10 TaxID=3023076 RepID=UPI0021C7B457|nr:AAA family ATPase [Glutamicibacter sp. M10]UXN30979.1 AAA family ATPase [Glutamicibacter sp. M10]